MNFLDSLDLALEQAGLVDLPGMLTWRPVSGGDINQAYLGRTPSGKEVFLKVNATEEPHHFSSEVAGLTLLELGLRDLQLRVPQVYAWGFLGNHTNGPRGLAQGTFLLMEYIEPKSAPLSKSWRVAGQELARLHSNHSLSTIGMETGKPYGLGGDNQRNRIGSSLQDNTPESNWAQFFCNHRLGFQIELAASRNRCPNKLIQDISQLLPQIAHFLPADPGASLVHGDLWGGNMFFDTQDRAVLIDPAVYFGHGETDLAMTKLFGGFTQDFYAGYREVRPSQLGFQDQNLLEEIYNLYHLLNHLNLFGLSYLGSVQVAVAVIQKNLT